MMLIWEYVNLTNLLAIPGLAPCNAAADNFPPQSVSGFPGYQSPPHICQPHEPAGSACPTAAFPWTPQGPRRMWARKRWPAQKGSCWPAVPHRSLPLDTPGSSLDVGEEEMARTEGELLASGPLGALVFFFLPVCPSHVSMQWTL